MSRVEADRPSPALSRLAQTSRLMAVATAVGIALLIGLGGLAVILPGWTRNIALAKLGEAGAALPITPLGQTLGAIVLAVPIGVMLYGLFAVQRMFRDFARGEILTAPAVQRLRVFAATVLAQGPLGPMTAAGLSAALSVGNPPSERAIMIAFSTNDYFAVIVGAVLFAAATVLHEAARLAEENKGFV